MQKEQSEEISKDSQKSPLYNINAERALLSCILKDPKSLLKLPFSLDRKDFYTKQNAKLYGKLVAFVGEDSIDTELVKSEEDVDSDYVDSLLELKVDPAKIGNYFDKIRDAAIRRSLLGLSKIVLSAVDSSEYKVSDIIHDLEKNIFDAVQRQQNPVVPVSEIVANVYEKTIKRSKGVPEERLYTGLKTLDYLTQGLSRGDLWLIGGSTSDGKSELMLQIVSNICIHQGYPSVIFSHEMTKEQLIERLLCLNSQVPMRNIKTGKLEQDELNRLQQAYNLISKSPLFIDDSAGISYKDVYSRVRWLKLLHPDLALVADDYVQLCAGKGGDNREQEVASVGRAFKTMAKTMKIAFLALSQLNVNPDQRSSDSPPRLADVRESKALTHDSQVVLLLWVPYKYSKDKNFDKSVTNLVVGKNRDGNTGLIHMKNELSTQRFIEVT